MSNTAPIVGAVANFTRVTAAPATTNATLIKASSTRMFKLVGCNLSTSDLTFHFTNLATAPTPGTTAVLDSRTVPASAVAGKCNPFSYDLMDFGWFFSAGAAYWVSTGAADTDATAPAAGAYTSSVAYQ